MPDRHAGLAATLSSLDLSGDAAAALGEARRLVSGYLLPRAAEPEAALVVAVVGLSGAGKSTIVNSVAGRRISEAGSKRPTTVEPVAWVEGELPPTLDLARRTLPGRLVETLRPAASGIVIVDTPPPGVRDESGPLAEQILDLADACVLVSEAHRYADGGSFHLAVAARRRDLPLVLVLNRLPATTEIQRVLVEDYAVKLARRGILDRPAPESIVPVSEGPVSAERQALPPDWVTGVSKEIQRLADPQARADTLLTVEAGTRRRLRTLLAAVRSALIDDEARRGRLMGPVAFAYAEEGDRLAARVAAGEFASAPDLAAALAPATARAAGRAALRAAGVWESIGVPVRPRLFAHDPATPQAVHDRIEWWRSSVPSLVGGGRRRAGRLAAAVIEAVANPNAKRRRSLRRRPDVVDTARRLLAEELRGVLEADASRFAEEAGPGPPRGALEALRA